MPLPSPRKFCALGFAVVLASAAQGRTDDSTPPASNPSEPEPARVAELRTETQSQSPSANDAGNKAEPRAPAGHEAGKAPAVAADWALRSATPVAISNAATPDAATRIAVRETLADSAQPRKASGETLRVDRKDKVTASFDVARRPGCFQPDGLKNQWTGPFSGILALPFIVVAAVRGKCN
jgi:hypothetical protein